MAMRATLDPAPVRNVRPRFGIATEEYKAFYTQFLEKHVLVDKLNTDAFFFIDQLRRKEPNKKHRRLALHDQLSIFLTKGEFQPLFKGLDTFVKELRQLLVAAGKIPKFVQWIPFKGRPYRLDAEHKNMSQDEAKNRLDSIRVVIVEMAKKHTQGG